MFFLKTTSFKNGANDEWDVALLNEADNSLESAISWNSNDQWWEGLALTSRQKCIRPRLDLNLRTHERGASTLPLGHQAMLHKPLTKSLQPTSLLFYTYISSFKIQIITEQKRHMFRISDFHGYI